MERFSRVLRGYDPEEVNRFLDKVIEQVEGMVQEIKVKDQEIKTKDEILKRYKAMETEYYALRQNKDQYMKMEETLKRAIVMAEKTSEQIKLTAYQERDIIVSDAKKNANRIVNESLLKAEQFQREADRLRRNGIIYKKRLRDVIETQLQMVDDIEKIELE